MKYLYFFVLLFLSPSLLAQSHHDSTGIKNTALDYIEGWYKGDAKRMEEALHPKLAKRIVAKYPQNDQNHLVQTSALELVQQTRRGGGSNTPKGERKVNVDILDIYGNASSVRVDAGGWVDYMHLAKWNGKWKIINVLWERNPDKK